MLFFCEQVDTVVKRLRSYDYLYKSLHLCNLLLFVSFTRTQKLVISAFMESITGNASTTVSYYCNIDQHNINQNAECAF